MVTDKITVPYFIGSLRDSAMYGRGIWYQTALYTVTHCFVYSCKCTLLPAVFRSKLNSYDYRSM